MGRSRDRWDDAVRRDAIDLLQGSGRKQHETEGGCLWCSGRPWPENVRRLHGRRRRRRKKKKKKKKKKKSDAKLI